MTEPDAIVFVVDDNAPVREAVTSLLKSVGLRVLTFGSGVADYVLNGIVQKRLTSRTTWRLNAGVIFSGNALSGAVGVGTRGPVYAGGTSLVRQFTRRLDLGAEVTGALAGGADPARRQLQAQAEGNYRLRENLTLDFGVVAGRYAAGPRLGAQLGFSLDF